MAGAAGGKAVWPESVVGEFRVDHRAMSMSAEAPLLAGLDGHAVAQQESWNPRCRSFVVTHSTTGFLDTLN